MQSLKLAALASALSQLGVTETAANSGPQIDLYLAADGLRPGNSWCVAGVYWSFRQASAQFGLTNPVPRTGSGLRLWRYADAVCRDSNPAPGRVYVLDHGGGKSHVGIVSTLDALGGVDDEVSFNTFNDRGGREGNTVAVHRGTPEVTHGGVLLGYLDFDRAKQWKDPT